jgi:hypothetical protein
VNNHQYDPTGGDGFIRGEWRQVENALLAGLITDEEYERIAMTHDDLCYRSHDQPLGRDPFCQCSALVKAREDERSNNFTPDDFSEAMTEAYQRGLNDAMEAVELIPAPYKVVGNFETYGAYHEGRSDMKDMALSAIDALRENRETPPPLPPSVGVPERRWT